MQNRHNLEMLEEVLYLICVLLFAFFVIAMVSHIYWILYIEIVIFGIIVFVGSIIAIKNGL